MNRLRTCLAIPAAAVALTALPTAGRAQASGNVQVTARLVDVRPQVAALGRVTAWLRHGALAVDTAVIRRVGAGDSPLIAWSVAAGRRGEPAPPRTPEGSESLPGEPAVVVELLFVEN